MVCGPCVRSWAQPNDCGVNASFSWTLGKVVSEENCGVEASKGGAVFNRIFRKAFLRFRTEQADRLARDRRNAITSAWETSGLRGALNPYCKGWTHAIQSFGEGSLLGLVVRSEAGGAEAGGAEAARLYVVPAKEGRLLRFDGGASVSSCFFGRSFLHWSSSHRRQRPSSGMLPVLALRS